MSEAGASAGPAEDDAGDGEPTSPHYHGHRQRLRRRFLDQGGTALSDYELLELLLALAIPRKDVKPLAKALLERFGGFDRVITATPFELEGVDGLGEASVAALKLAQAAAERLARDRVLDRPVLGSWSQLLDYLRIAMAHEPVEQIRLLFLDRKNRLIADEVQHRGTLDHTPVYPREVARRAITLSASAVILVHNHPSGDPTPSRADIDMTEQVRRALEAIGVVLHDHLVVGSRGHASFKAMGLL